MTYCNNCLRLILCCFKCFHSMGYLIFLSLDVIVFDLITFAFNPFLILICKYYLYIPIYMLSFTFFFYRTSMQNNNFMLIELSCINKFIIIIIIIIIIIVILYSGRNCPRFKTWTFSRSSIVAHLVFL